MAKTKSKLRFRSTNARGSYVLLVDKEMWTRKVVTDFHRLTERNLVGPKTILKEGQLLLVLYKDYHFKNKMSTIFVSGRAEYILSYRRCILKCSPAAERFYICSARTRWILTIRTPTACWRRALIIYLIVYNVVPWQYDNTNGYKNIIRILLLLLLSFFIVVPARYTYAVAVPSQVGGCSRCV